MKKVSKFLIKGLILLFGKLPLKVQYANARFIAWLVGSVVGYRRDDVMINLSRSFPDKKYEDLIQIKKDFYNHFADLIVETFWFGASDSKRIRKQEIVRVANPEVLEQLYETSPSVMVMLSHGGNWELIGGCQSYVNTPKCIEASNFCVTYKKQHSEVWNEILAENRKAPVINPEQFSGYIESSDAVRYVFEHRQDKKIYHFITDQSPYQISVAKTKLEFMHQPTLSMTAAAALAHKFGMAVAYMSMMPDGRGHYRLEYTAICNNAAEMTAEEITRKYYELLEKDLNRAPENYLWTHRRWKEVAE